MGIRCFLSARDGGARLAEQAHLHPLAEAGALPWRIGASLFSWATWLPGIAARGAKRAAVGAEKRV